jgi:MFS family permease
MFQFNIVFGILIAFLSNALLQAVGIGVTNLVFTFVGLWLIDRLGRRTLLYAGSVGYIVSLGLVSWAFFTGHHAIVPVCIFAFIAARATGQALGCFTHWIFAALLTTFFPRMVTAFPPGYVFLFFAFMMALQLVWVRLMVPETKGVPLEELEEKLALRR